MLNVSEIFLSLQGESAQCGRVCSFIRLSGCNLRCVWCDTPYAREAEAVMPVDEVIAEVGKHYSAAPPAHRLVEVTGGEPLLQAETPELCKKLLNLGYEVMIETNGTQDIGALPPAVSRVIDVKCPGSGEAGSFLMGNIGRITPGDELKFALASLADAEWAKALCDNYGLAARCPITFSPVPQSLPYKTLAEWMTENRLSGIRMGMQLHKLIWGDERGR
jgi:7-carboxy-7-deazaguanine synthase